MKRMNEFRKIYDSNDYKRSLNDFPYIIDIELTNHCNLDCKMCSRQIMTREKGYITRDTFNNIMMQCKGRDVGIRFIRWGEPFLHPHLPDFCKQIKDAGHPLHITTNGLAMSEAHMKGLVEIGVDSIIFSMQGLSEEEYASIRDTSLFDILSNNIKLLHKIRGKREKPYITITTTYTPSEKTTEYHAIEFKKKWLKYADDVQVGITNMARLTDEKPEELDYIKCREPWQKVGIDWNGDVTACCGDYDAFLKIGNVNEATIYDLWHNNPILVSIRTLLSNDCNRHLTLCSKCYPAYGNLNDK